MLGEVCIYEHETATSQLVWEPGVVWFETNFSVMRKRETSDNGLSVKWETSCVQ